MTLALHILPEAEAELLAAAEWYSSQQADLGVSFVQAVDQALALIVEAPRLSPLWRQGHPYRRHVLRRFPYIIIFKTSQSVIEVTAIAHARQKPGYWLSRMMPGS